MTAPTFENLSHLTGAIVREVAMHMSVPLTDPQIETIAEAVAYEMDEGSAANLLFAPDRRPEAITAVSELVAKHVRYFFFIQVGTGLGDAVGYDRRLQRHMNLMMHFAAIYDAAFEKAFSDRPTEMIKLPPVAEYVRAALTMGLEFCDLYEDDEGCRVEEWFLAQYEPEHDSTHLLKHRLDGPAILRTDGSGTVLYEAYCQYDVPHRIGEPAVIERNASGETIRERYFDFGHEIALPMRRADA